MIQEIQENSNGEEYYEKTEKRKIQPSIRSRKRRKQVFIMKLVLLCAQAAFIALLVFFIKSLLADPDDPSSSYSGRTTYAKDQSAEQLDSAADTTEETDRYRSAQTDTTEDKDSSIVKDPETGYKINLLMLVNAENYIPDDYDISIKDLGRGQAVASICYKDLQEMLDDCRKEGHDPVICSSYRTMEKQQTLFSNRTDRFVQEGYDRETAEKKAATVVAIPGTSEHQLGLALDIVDVNNQMLNDSQETTPVQQWLMNNSYKYGFILRYPKDMSGQTGIIYEPWHYRYVGKDAARYMYEHDLCLEEYLDL